MSRCWLYVQWTLLLTQATAAFAHLLLWRHRQQQHRRHRRVRDFTSHGRPEVVLAVTLPVGLRRPVAGRRRRRRHSRCPRGCRRRPLRDTTAQATDGRRSAAARCRRGSVTTSGGRVCSSVDAFHLPRPSWVTPSHHQRVHGHIRVHRYDLGSTLMHHWTHH